MTDPAPALAGRAAELVERLGLRLHPEGGYFAEPVRSARRVRPADPADPQPARLALTSIYFLLTAGTHSRWHRVESDEVWHHYEGDPLELLWVEPDLATLHLERLGPVDAAGDVRPLRVVPAGCWQAARPLGTHVLVGCTVAPGFDFADFALLDDRPDEAAVLRARHPLVRALG